MSETKVIPPHPIQPVICDAEGILRFKENEIVRFLFDAGQVDMNDLMQHNFSQQDREQFAQLIGYSLGGFEELSYVSYETAEVAYRMVDDCEHPPELVMRNEELRHELKQLKEKLRQAFSGLVDIITE